LLGSASVGLTDADERRKYLRPFAGLKRGPCGAFGVGHAVRCNSEKFRLAVGTSRFRVSNDEERSPASAATTALVGQR
jgi:hypothetical protein